MKKNEEDFIWYNLKVFLENCTEGITCYVFKLGLCILWPKKYTISKLYYAIGTTTLKVIAESRSSGTLRM